MRTDLNTLTFGIEIECTIPDASMREQGWTIGQYHVGADIAGHPGWKTMHDGSIQARYPNVGVEVVSPILRGLDGLQQIETMVAKLMAMGAHVNRSTGFHVHVGWGGNVEQLRRLICFVAFHEKALFASTGTRSREHNQFCSSIKARYQQLQALTSESEILYAGISRYHVLNLRNLNNANTGKRTVEFRVFAGTLNIVKMLSYVQLCLGIVSKALDNHRKALPWDAPMKTRQDVGDGLWAMRVLLTHLHWRKAVRPGRCSAGVLNVELMPKMLRALNGMAKQYDNPDGTRRPRRSRVAAAPTVATVAADRFGI